MQKTLKIWRGYEFWKFGEDIYLIKKIKNEKKENSNL